MGTETGRRWKEGSIYTELPKGQERTFMIPSRQGVRRGTDNRPWGFGERNPAPGFVYVGDVLATEGNQ